ncbi:MAG: hypothetical protein ACP5C4_09240 [Methanomicrobiales archaeon]
MPRPFTPARPRCKTHAAVISRVAVPERTCRRDVVPEAENAARNVHLRAESPGTGTVSHNETEEFPPSV